MHSTRNRPKKEIAMKIQLAILAVVLLAGCARDNGQEDASRGDAVPTPTGQTAPAAAAAMGAPADAQASPDASVAVEAMGMGTITAIDAAAGKVTIEHGPIDSLHWPAMTMAFNASPEVLGSIKEGDRVHFEFTQQGRTGTISKLARVN